MACINILVGQCGNQLGGALYNALSREAADTHDEAFQTDVSTSFFREATKSEKRSLQGVAMSVGAGAPLPVPRAVLVDMETKVVEQSLSSATRYSFTSKQCVTREEGSANNWACGYFQQGPSRIHALEEAIRREVELADSVGLFHVVHSLAGGTGSGVGCLTSDCLREMFPRAILLHTAVLPYSHGETTTQWYNTVLSCSTLHETADGIHLLSNEDVGVALEASRNALNKGSPGRTSTGDRRRSQPAGGTAVVEHRHSLRVSLSDINAVMADTLASLLLPSSVMPQVDLGSCVTRKGHNPSASSPSTELHQRGADSGSVAATMHALRPRLLSDIVEIVAADPARKFFEGTSCPRVLGGLSAHLSNTSWPHCINEALRETSWGRFAARCPHFARDPSSVLLWDGAAACVPFPADRYALILRGASASPGRHQSGGRVGSTTGGDASGFEELGRSIGSLTSSPHFLEVVHEHCPFSDRFDFKKSFLPHGVLTQPTTFHGETAHVSLFHTSQSVGRRIAFATGKAEKMFNERAFLHHFERYGMEDDNMRDALGVCWHVARAYNAPATAWESDNERGSSSDFDEQYNKE